VFKRLISCFLIIISTPAFTQKKDSANLAFRIAEQELLEQRQAAFYSHNEAERLAANKKIIAIWDRIVTDPKILNYGFSEVKGDYAILSPKDKKFKLITWNIYKNDGTHAFFGYLLVNNSKRIKKGWFRHETLEAYEYFKLIDRSPTVKSPETYVGTPDKWFGMLYYSLVECDGYYTLLGYDLNDNLTRKKFVDVLYFKLDGTPVFGKDVFKFPKKNPRRLMFEFSSDVTMSLKYDEKRNQIVYSHLGPNQEGELLEGQFQYYGPDGSYDALELHKDKWVLIEKVDVLNEKNEKDELWNDPKKPRKKPNKKLMPKDKTKKN
jgi:hypothetical protein